MFQRKSFTAEKEKVKSCLFGLRVVMSDQNESTFSLALRSSPLPLISQINLVPKRWILAVHLIIYHYYLFLRTCHGNSCIMEFVRQNSGKLGKVMKNKHFYTHLKNFPVKFCVLLEFISFLVIRKIYAQFQCNSN